METQTGSGRAMADAALLFTEDTVIVGLQMMQEHRLTELAVVEAVSGEWVGAVSSDELMDWWRASPLARVGDLLAMRAKRESLNERPRVTIVSPLVDVLRVSKKWMQ